MMYGVEHDEAISIYALQMRARRLLRRHCLSAPPLTMTPRNDNYEVFQQSLSRGKNPTLPRGISPLCQVLRPAFCDCIAQIKVVILLIRSDLAIDGRRTCDLTPLEFEQ